jgi:hypothetical protein
LVVLRVSDENFAVIKDIVDSGVVPFAVFDKFGRDDHAFFQLPTETFILLGAFLLLIQNQQLLHDVSRHRDGHGRQADREVGLVRQEHTTQRTYRHFLLFGTIQSQLLFVIEVRVKPVPQNLRVGNEPEIEEAHRS